MFVITSKGTNPSCPAQSGGVAININPLPIPALVVPIASPTCIGTTQTYTTQSGAGISNYIWVVNGGTVVGGGNGNAFVNVLWNSTTTTRNNFV